MAKKITDKVTWVGKIDWELVYFHGHELSDMSSPPTKVLPIIPIWCRTKRRR